MFGLGKTKEQKELEKQQNLLDKKQKENLDKIKKMGKEQYFLKTVNDVERVIDHCKQKHWLTKSQWEEHGIPMKQLIQEMLTAYKAYKENQMKEIMGEVGNVKIGRN